MEKTREYLLYFMEGLNFPEEAKKVFLDVDSLFELGSNYGKEMNSIIRKFYADYEHHQTNEILEELNCLAEKMGVNCYTMHLIFYMYCSEILLEKYKESNVSEDIFWNSMLDLRCKLFECHNRHGVWGSFVGGWFTRFFTMERFGLGRLQYEYETFPYAKYTRSGFTVYKGDKVYNIHIPSSGPLTRDKRMDSYKRAYEFYKGELDGGPLVAVCDSWLLYPENEKFYPEKSNIIDFMHDFEIINTTVHDKFNSAWRVFGKDHNKPIEELPVDTALQRAYVSWLKEGNKTGNGYGILLFDGQRIL